MGAGAGGRREPGSQDASPSPAAETSRSRALSVGLVAAFMTLLDVSIVATGMQVPAHPHTGLQTVSWLLEGQILHRDSLGSRQLIEPGQRNLMTSGRGIPGLGNVVRLGPQGG